MQNLYLYATYDRKAQLYMAPFAQQHEAQAVRLFTEAVMTSETPVSQYPADFDLMRVGIIDIESGAITPETPVPYPVINGLVALQDAQRERSRYQAILDPQPVAETTPDAA